MNTILTDDEIHKWWASENGMEDADMAKLTDFREVTRKVEAAVLAKLREQEPVAWLYKGDPWFDGKRWREEMRATLDEQLAKFKGEPQPLYAAPQPAVVQVPQGVDVEGRRIAAEAENHACSLAVWMTRMDAESPDADDLGVSGWLQEAEKRIKRRMLAAAPEAPGSVTVKVYIKVDPETCAYLRGDPPSAPEAPAQGAFVHDPACKMCEGRGYYVAGYSGREDDGNAPIHEECDCWIPNTEAPSQPSVPAPWREAVKVAREALEALQADVHPAYFADSLPRMERVIKAREKAAAAIALADSLEGGE